MGARTQDWACLSAGRGGGGVEGGGNFSFVFNFQLFFFQYILLFYVIFFLNSSYLPEYTVRLFGPPTRIGESRATTSRLRVGDSGGEVVLGECWIL